MLYIKNNIEHQQIQERCTRQLPWNALIFLLFFLPFLIRLMIKDGFSTAAEAGMSAVSSGCITLESMKYLYNLTEMPILLVILLIGIVLVLFGIFKSSRSVEYRRNLVYGHRNRAHRTGSSADSRLEQYRLLSVKHRPSEFAHPRQQLQQRVHAPHHGDSFLLIPFVLAYIVFAWRAIDRKRITQEEIEQGEAY